MRKVTFPAILDKVSTLKDGSVKINFETREFSPEDTAVLFSLRNSEGHLLFASDPLNDADVPDAPINISKRTPSQRLRAVLYLYSRRLDVKDFETFYRTKMESFIDSIKGELDA